MTAIFLSVITFGVLIFFIINRSLMKFLPNKRVQYASAFAYIVQLVGLIGLIIYHVEFLSTPPLKIEFSASSPNFIRAIAELMWPICAIIAVFWFLPQILEFIKDPRQSIPVLTALSGRQDHSEQQAFVNSVDVKKLPHYANLSDAHKELIENLKAQLINTSPEEERSRLLIHASDWQLAAEFERLYNLIYGSQIQALQMLLKNSDADISSFFETHKEKAKDTPDAGFDTFDKWIRLLLDTRVVSANDGKYSITNKGKAFLTFLENRHYYLLKAF